jgi:signal transduction histidine kinase
MSGFDYQKYGVLYADDDSSALKRFKDEFGSRFRVLTADTAESAMEQLTRDRVGIGLVLCGRSLADAHNFPFLTQVRKHNPKILRLPVTAPTEPPISLEALQNNNFYQSIQKPWVLPQVEVTLLRAMEYFLMQLDHDRLLEEKSAVLHRLLVLDRVVRLGVLATDLSHHLRHVMPAVQSFMDVASPRLEASSETLSELRQPEAWKNHAERSRVQMLALQHTLNDMGDSAKAFLPVFNDQVQPHSCFAKAAEHFKTRLAEQGIQAVNNIPKNLPSLKSDAVLLDRMMDSLFEEALSCLPPGSEIRMDGVKESDQLIRLQVSCGSHSLRLDRFKWVFDPFETLDPGGVKPGLHLMAAFLVIYHHGGVVHSALEAGKGSVLRFHLPIDPDKMMVTEGERNFLNKMLFSESLWEEFLGHND